ncbi:MAG: hypothetical protein Q4C46_05600 [Bacillota bacterium]|nr:hypothetical protein [Bacillota bacterium]
MSRLTQWIDDQAIPRVDIRNNGYERCTNKLAHYEDLEEQGRLIELPCAVGDTVYVINKHCPSPWKKEYCDDARNILPKDPCSVCPHRTAYIAPGKYNLKYLTRESEIFYTKEAAEAKLKEMEGAE